MQKNVKKNFKKFSTNKVAFFKLIFLPNGHGTSGTGPRAEPSHQRASVWSFRFQDQVSLCFPTFKIVHMS